MKHTSTCPACNFNSESNFDTCPKCGVIVAKFLEKQAERNQKEAERQQAEREKWTAEQERQRKQQEKAESQALKKQATKKCPSCAMQIPAKAHKCPYCRKTIKTSPVALAVAGGILLLMFIGMCSTSNNQSSPPSEASYSDSINIEISRALVAKEIRTCGEYKWALNPGTNSEYTVKCSPDGKTWYTYLVWPKIQEVTFVSKQEPPPEIEQPKPEQPSEPPPPAERVPLPITTDKIPYIDKESKK